MREDLIGYLLDVLDPTERQQVEAALNRDTRLREELKLVSRALVPLEADKGYFDPPSGLAERTCQFVAARIEVSLSPAPQSLAPGAWRLADFVVAAGIFLAASLLFFPAMNQSRFAARLASCQNNLRQIGTALTDYATLHKGYFPSVPAEGSLSAAGIYATTLFDQGFLKGPEVVLCPASDMADKMRDFRVPTAEELQRATASQLAELHQVMGGSYGYNLGYIDNGQYRGHRNLGRERFALMADAPSGQKPYYSLNHGGTGQNVLFEDLHVQYLTSCRASGCNDDIFVNDSGHVAPGLHLHDSVIGASHSKPMVPRGNLSRPASGQVPMGIKARRAVDER